MCGIYGFAGQPNDPEAVTKLMKRLAIETETRGKDSSGFVALTENNYYFEKGPWPARDLADEDFFAEAIKEKGVFYFLGHNRAASIGKINIENSHPFEGDRYFLVHNGTVPLAKVVAKEGGIKTEGTTDSEAILKIIESFKTLENALKFIKEIDDYSLVLIDKQADTMYFMRDTYKPMFFVDLRKQLGIRIFASTPGIIFKALVTSGLASPYGATKITEEGFSSLPGCLYKMDRGGELTKIKKYKGAKNAKASSKH